MAKTKTQIEDIAKIVGKTTGAFQDPPLIDAPFTEIKNLDGSDRQLPDPSKTLKPAMGIERIMFREISEVSNEKASDGRVISKCSDERIRFIGPIQYSSQFGGGNNGASVNLTSNADDAIEVTFYGTGLNLLVGLLNAGRNITVTVDGASYPDIVANDSTVIDNRNYNANHVFNAVSGLSLGVHTVQLTIGTNGSLPVQGVEILNESAQIQIPQGEVLANGRKYVQSAATTTPHDSGFDGAPTLNGRGGRVLMYKLPDDETVYKAIQQTDAAQANLASADHSNEEMIRKINFREFGANRADDFSTLSTASPRAFTLDDGTTTLITSSGQVGTQDFGEGVFPSSISNFITLTFVGTGLDIYNVDAVNSDTYIISVDGTTVDASYAWNAHLNTIVSGLPYGTHTVKLLRNGNSSSAVFSDFIIYGPKKPTIPSDAQEISDYYLMADFVANAVQGTNTIATGTLRKDTIRELTFVGTGWAVSSVTPARIGGFSLATSTSGASFEYTFFGTGFEWRWEANTTDSTDVSVTLNSLALTAANFATASFSTYGAGVSYNSGTGSLDQSSSAGVLSGSGFSVSGLPLALYTIKATNNVALIMEVNALDIIAPIHFPNTKVGSLSMGGDVKVLEQSEESAVDLSKAKAWLAFDMPNNQVLGSENISAVIDVNNGTLLVYFEKPFKSANYAALASAEEPAGLAVNAYGASFRDKRANSINCQLFSTGGPSSYEGIANLVFFGELADEGDE